jgi:hypothetical protein
LPVPPLPDGKITKLSVFCKFESSIVNLEREVL